MKSPERAHYKQKHPFNNSVAKLQYSFQRKARFSEKDYRC